MPHLAAVHSNLMRPASLELPLHERGVTARQLHADAKVTDGLRCSNSVVIGYLSMKRRLRWTLTCRPPAPLTIPIRNRSFGSRPIGASILPVSRSGKPSTIARYLRRTDLRANCSCKPACAAASFAITSNPEVPLSMRCTTPVNKT